MSTKAEKKARSRFVESLVKLARVDDVAGIESALQSSNDQVGLWFSPSNGGQARSVLHEAAASGSLNTVKWALDYEGTVIDAADRSGRTALHDSSGFGHLAVTKLLISKGAKVNVLKRTDWTPLMLAAAKGHIEVVRELLLAGADANIVNKDGWSAVHIVAREGNTELLELFVSHLGQSAAVKTVARNGRTPLHSASLANKPEMVQALIDAGADLEARDSSGMTALLDAVSEGGVEATRVLLSAGAKADASIVNCVGHNVGHLVALGGWTTMLDLLPDCSVFSASDEAGSTPLHLACVRDHAAMAAALLLPPFSVAVDVSNKAGRTPLHVAAAWGATDVVNVLLKNGADVSAMDSNGQLPWTKSPAVKSLLESHATSREMETSTTSTTSTSTADIATQPVRPHMLALANKAYAAFAGNAIVKGEGKGPAWRKSKPLPSDPQYVRAMIGEAPTSKESDEGGVDPTPFFHRLWAQAASNAPGAEARTLRKIIWTGLNEAYDAGSYWAFGTSASADEVVAVPFPRVDVSGTVQYSNPDELPAVWPAKYASTRVWTQDCDTLDAALELIKSHGVSRPLVLNMASEKHAGGGVRTGAGAQEENLCRRSNYMWALDPSLARNGREDPPTKYPIPEFGGVVSRGITVVRGNEDLGYPWLAEPYVVDMIAVAGYRRPPVEDDPSAPNDRKKKILPAKYAKGTRRKVQMMLRAAASVQAEGVVLSALGCGAFRNPPAHVASIFHDVLAREFAGVFRVVVFAILDNGLAKANAGSNIIPFTKVFGSPEAPNNLRPMASQSTPLSNKS